MITLCTAVFFVSFCWQEPEEQNVGYQQNNSTNRMRSWQAKIKNSYKVPIMLCGSQIYSMHSLHVTLEWLCCRHMDLLHLVQHFATFLSLDVGHKEQRFLLCKMISVCRDVFEKPRHVSSQLPSQL